MNNDEEGNDGIKPFALINSIESNVSAVVRRSVQTRQHAPSVEFKVKVPPTKPI